MCYTNVPHTRIIFLCDDYVHIISFLSEVDKSTPIPTVSTIIVFHLMEKKKTKTIEVKLKCHIRQQQFVRLVGQ